MIFWGMVIKQRFLRHFYIDSKGINGARFAYMTKYFVLVLTNTLGLWPICDLSLRSWSQIPILSYGFASAQDREFSISLRSGKNPNAMRRRSRSLALEFVKRAKRVFTNWPKCEVFWQGHDKIFCHVSKPSSISPLNLVPFGPFMPQSL